MNDRRSSKAENLNTQVWQLHRWSRVPSFSVLSVSKVSRRRRERSVATKGSKSAVRLHSDLLRKEASMDVVG